MWRPRLHRWTRWTALGDGGMELATLQLQDGSVLIAGGVQRHYCPPSGDHTPSHLAYRYFPGR